MVGIQHPVRQASAADLAAVLELDEPAQLDAERRLLLSESIERGECLVYDEHDRVVGFIVIRPRHFFGRDFIELLMVSPEVRRRGVGRALMAAALARQGTTDAFTSTNRSNDPMRELLKAGGWVFSGQLEGLDQGDSELVYFHRRD